jgi:hypothetical protein
MKALGSDLALIQPNRRRLFTVGQALTTYCGSADTFAAIMKKIAGVFAADHQDTTRDSFKLFK